MAFFTYTAFTLNFLGLTFNRKYLISALLCIEGMMLALYVTLTALPQVLMAVSNLIGPALLLALAACGASTGLALLIANARSRAATQLKTLSLLKC